MIPPGAGPDRREWLAGAGSIGIGFALPRRPAQPNATTARGAVVLFLNGGNDAANTFVPLGRAQHAVYARARRHLALPRTALLPLSSTGQRARFGLHPACRELRRALEAGHAQVWLDVDLGIGPHSYCHHRATAAWHRLLGAPPRRTVSLTSLPAVLLQAGRTASEHARWLWIDVDGFDLHHDLLARHARLWTGIDIALGAWLRAFGGAGDAPTLTIASEFGRALEPRGSGADHGGCAHAIAIGDPPQAIPLSD